MTARTGRAKPGPSTSPYTTPLLGHPWHYVMVRVEAQSGEYLACVMTSRAWEDQDPSVGDTGDAPLTDESTGATPGEALLNLAAHLSSGVHEGLFALPSAAHCGRAVRLLDGEVGKGAETVERGETLDWTTLGTLATQAFLALCAALRTWGHDEIQDAYVAEIERANEAALAALPAVDDGAPPAVDEAELPF